jgi:hypothetical protein
MLPEKSKQTQLVAKIARRIIASNSDIPDISLIKWSVRVVVSTFYLRIYIVLYFSFIYDKGYRYEKW